MGRLTEAKIEMIKRAFSTDPSYTNVARKLGVDKRTVMRHVGSGSEETIQDGKEMTHPLNTQRKKASQSLSSLAFKLMKENVSPLDIAIELGLHEQEYRGYRQQFLRLVGNYRLDELYEELSDDEALGAFTELFEKMKDEGMINRVQEFVILLRHGMDWKKNEELLNAQQDSMSKNQDELNSLQHDIANNKEVLERLTEEIRDKRDAWNSLDYNSKTLTGQLRVTQQRLDLLRNQKTYKKVINIIRSGILDKIKDKDEFIRAFPLATCIAFRKMQIQKRRLLVKYSGHDRLLEEPDRTLFNEARSELYDLTEQELSVLYMNKSLEDFEDNFEDVILEYQAEKAREDEDSEEEPNEE